MTDTWVVTDGMVIGIHTDKGELSSISKGKVNEKNVMTDFEVIYPERKQ